MGPRLQKRSNLPRHAWAMGLAACAHLLALLLLGWRIPKLAAPAPSEDRSVAMEVTLVRPQVRQRLPPRAGPAGPSRSAPRALPRVLVTPTPGAPALSAPVQSPPVSPEAAPNGQRLQDALRGLVGCSDPKAYGLTGQQREACDRRLAAAKPAPLARQFSAEELAQFDAENKYDPILVRKPHNGCLPRVGDTPAAGSGVAASSGATTTLGINCAWSF